MLVKDSRFWKPLWRQYGKGAPSIALCRVPELEYASSLKLDGSTLDHCCGDGIFASLAWPTACFSAGCDISESSVARAKALGKHERLDICDASERLPYEDATFDLVFNNSALEHISAMEAAVDEVARVTKTGGLFAFNILNYRFYKDWWPMDESAMKDYCGWQPVHHILTLAEWQELLPRHGFAIKEVKGYFPKDASATLAELDFEFSGAYLGGRRSSLVADYKSMLGRQRRSWRKRLEKLEWQTESDAGAGYFIVCERTG